ncbi:MAG: EamA family transporter [Spirochaetes bacterium]|nr:EamA family transporter [Spirochaetota bacterium]
MPPTTPPYRTLLLLLLALLAFASAFVATRAAVAVIHPSALACGRYLTASLVFAAMALAKAPTRPIGREWIRLAVCGALGIGLYNIGFNQGIHEVPAGTTSLIMNGVIPLGTALGAIALLREKIGWRWWLAMAGAVAGLLAIALGRDGRLGGSGIPWLLVASACGVVLNLGQKPLLPRMGALSVTSWIIWFGTLPLLPWAPQLVSDLRAHPAALVQVLYLGVVPGALAYLLWAIAMRRFSAAHTGMTLFTLPAQVVFFAWLFLGELPAPSALAGGALIILSVAWAAWPRGQQSPVPKAPIDTPTKSIAP